MRPRRPLQVVSFAVTSVLGFGLAGWFGFFLGIVIWLALRLFMHVRPWPPTSSFDSSSPNDRSLPRA